VLEELKKLKDLQILDVQIFEKEEELEAIPDQNENLKEKIKEMEEKLNELKNSIAIQDEERLKRVDILNKGEDKLKGITGKQSAIRNKEEYGALLREIDNIKRFNRDLSDEIKEIEREVEFKNVELSAIEDETVKKIADYKKTIENNLAKMETLEDDLDDMYEKRDALAEKIRPVIYRKYQRIIENSQNGKAIADAENKVCLGCNMTLPPELFNIVLRAERIEVCPNCQCILIPCQCEKTEENQ